MKKYYFVFWMAWQQTLQHRATFFFERARSFFLLISLYFLWSALLAKQESFLGYDLPKLLTYVFGLNILRALVLAGNAYEIAYEINSGRLSNHLLKPLSFQGYWAAFDLAEKALYTLSAVLEMAVLLIWMRAPLFVPTSVFPWVATALAVASAMVLYFLMSLWLGMLGFWTAESSGPIFCFEILMSFAAGAFFPLDVLPKAFQSVLQALPFSYLVFFPLKIFLEQMTLRQTLLGMAVLWMWIGLFSLIVKQTWARGLKFYAAEGG